MGPTASNRASSRSHTIIKIMLEGRPQKEANIWLVELTGSELLDGKDSLHINSDLFHFQGLLTSKGKRGHCDMQVRGLPTHRIHGNWLIKACYKLSSMCSSQTD